MSNNGTQNPYSPHGQPTPQNLQQHQYNGAEQASHNTGNRGPSHITQGQAIEASDGNLGNIIKSTTTVPDQSLRQNNIEMSRGTLQRQESDIAAAASSEGGESVSSYNPPSATPPESSQIIATKNPGAQSMDTGEPSKYQGRGAFEMRELAKGALLSLAPHNIKFSDLLAEGIDAQVLSQLFEEVGLKTGPTLEPKTTATSASLTVTPKVTQGPVKPGPKTDLPSQMAMDQPAAQGAASPATSRVEQNDMSARSVLAPSKVPEIQPISTPAMERKDRIAALLAAKTGKPIPRKDSPAALPPSLQAAVSSTPPTTASNLPAPQSQPLQPSPAPVPVQATVIPSDSKPTPKPKNKAQTELVRQKMEQLKRETLAKAQAQEASQMLALSSTNPAASNLSNSVSTYPQAGLPPKPVLDQPLKDNAQINRMNAGFAPPSSTTFSSSIPGLFMMDAKPDPAPFGILNGTSTVRSTTSSDAPSGIHAERPGTLDLSTLSRESSSSRVPSKRPLAADAFDEQEMPPAKQLDSRPSSSRGQEATSHDDNSEDFSDGEIMEIDEGSPVSPLPKTPGARRWPVNGSVGAALPGANNYLLSPVYQQGNATTERIPEKQKRRATDDRREAEHNIFQQQSSASSPRSVSTIGKFSTPASLPITNAVPVSTTRQQQSQDPMTPETVEQAPVSVQPILQAPSTAIDRVQREKELREKLLRDRLQRKNMLKQGLPELDKEVQKTQNRQAEAQARLAQLRQEAEKREEEAREARRREQEIMEEVKRLEQQLEMGINGQQQFSHEMETLEQETKTSIPAKIPPKTELEPTIPQIQSTGTETPPVNYTDEDNSGDSFQAMEGYDEQPENGGELDSGDSVSDSEDESQGQVYNNRHVRPSAEAALPTTEEEAAFLEPAAMDESVSEEDFTPQEIDKGGLEDDVSSGGDSQADSDDSPMEVDSDNDGSASMSDSGSEDYQPAEPIISNPAIQLSDEEDEEYDPMDAPISGTPPVFSEQEQEEYAPSEVVEPLEVQVPMAGTVIEQTGSPASKVTASENEPEHGDDREHGLELTEANTLTTSQEVLPSVVDAADTNNVRTTPHPSNCLTSSRPLVHLNVPPLPVSPRTKVL
jgi:hypothetical protein